MSTSLAAMAVPSRNWLAGAWLLLVTGASALLLVACNVNNPGVTPPERELNFPLVLTTSAQPAPDVGPEWLYVVNSNFNFRYNSGTLQSFDLEEVDKALDRSCRSDFQRMACEDLGGELDDGRGCCVIDGACFEENVCRLADGAWREEGEDGPCCVQDPDDPMARCEPVEGPGRTRCEAVGGSYNADRDRCCLACRDVDRDILCDGRDAPALEACCYDTLKERGRSFIPDGGEVRVESFGSGIELSSEGDHLYLSLRSNDSLLRVDVDGSQLECGQGKDRRCADSEYVGVQPPLEFTEAQLSRLPADLVVVPAAQFGLAGGADLIFTGHDDGSVSFLIDSGGGPSLRANLGVLYGRINAMRFDPISQLVYVAQSGDPQQGIPGSYVARVGAEQITTNCVGDECDRPIVPFVSSPLILNGLVDNSYVRDIAFSPVADGSAEGRPLAALIRGGSTLVRSLSFLELDPSSVFEAQVQSAARVGAGPARLEQATLAGTDYLFVSCYDDGTLYIFNDDTRQLVSYVRGLYGPVEFSVDSVREVAYVADFASSTLRVVDLRGLRDVQFPKPRVVLTLGEPRLESGAL